MNRIAYLASEYPAPSHTFIRREIAAMRAAGLDISVFSIRPARGSPRSEIDRAACAETQNVLGRSPFNYILAVLQAFLTAPFRTAATLRLALAHRAPGLRPMIWAVFHFIEAVLLAALMRRAAVRRLHVHFANSGATVGLLAANLLGIPWSMTLHGISETDYPAGLLLADKVARADFVACASWFMRAQAMRVCDPSHWSKLHIVRCGIDPAALPAPTTPTGPAITFVSVGRLSSEKGQRGLLEAFAIVRRTLPDTRLELVGDGPLRDELEKLAVALGLAPAVRFHGALPEAETLQIVAGADVFVLPSFMEGLPVVIIEAMALGKPVVASGVAGIPELIKDGTNGLLVPPSHGDALAQAMIVLASDREIRERLSHAGRTAALDEFAIELAVKPLIPLLSNGLR